MPVGGYRPGGVGTGATPSGTGSARASRRTFLAVSALLFGATAAVTVGRAASMMQADGVAMPGGWTMSMAWLRVPGQTWLGAAASFVGMWLVMMVAMMLPSLLPALWRYRQAVGGAGEAGPGRLTALVGVAYFVVWTAFGSAVFTAGAAFATLALKRPGLSSAVPMLAGMAVVMAGILQLTPWKARHLTCCRKPTGQCGVLPPNAGTAWRHGLRLGLHCCDCCLGLMAIQVALGVMDLWVMGVVAAAITIERLAPAGVRLARATGAAAIGAGLLLVARTAGLG